MAYDPENIFAKILRGEIPNKTVFENDHALAFHDISPQAAQHVLVIPKGPYIDMTDFASEATADEQAGFLAALGTVIKQLGLDKTGYRLIANAGRDGRQEVPHMHVHILGGHDMGRMTDPAIRS